jgi:hypothetical protein
MIKIKWLKGILVQKMPLVVIAMTLTIGLSLPLLLLHQQTPTLAFLLGDLSPAISALMSLDNAFADHGQEITLTLYNSSFGSLTSGGGNQVSVFANYKLNDDSIAGQTINAVMEVYAPNGTLIRTSSYPDGFVAQSSGIDGLETTIKDPTVQSVTANVTFRNADKTAILSKDLRVNLNLGEEGTTAPTTGEGTADLAAGEELGVEEGSPGLESESEQEQVPSTQQPDQEGEEGGDGTGQEEEDGEEGENGGEGQELPLPLFGGPGGV